MYDICRYHAALFSKAWDIGKCYNDGAMYNAWYMWCALLLCGDLQQ